MTGDFNGDGRLDLAVLEHQWFTCTCSWAMGTAPSGPPLRVPIVQSAEIPTPTLVTGDFNGDGRLDLAVSEYADAEHENITILPGNGDGTFGQPLEIPVALVGVESLVAGDFNHDGNLDLAAEGSDPQTASTEAIVVLMGNGDGTFQAPRYLDTALNSFETGGLATGDFNGDGRLDLATGGYDDQTVGDELEVFLGNGDGTFQPATSSTVGPIDAQGFIAGDLNGDGRLDLIGDGLDLRPTPSITVYLGNGDGTFQSSPLLSDLGAAPRRGFQR